jgi:SNF family Na+-dependent transporter
VQTCARIVSHETKSVKFLFLDACIFAACTFIISATSWSSFHKRKTGLKEKQITKLYCIESAHLLGLPVTVAMLREIIKEPLYTVFHAEFTYIPGHNYFSSVQKQTANLSDVSLILSDFIFVTTVYEQTVDDCHIQYNN